MKRRQFIKLSAAAGLVTLTPWSKYALASEELRGFPGPFWITINLQGAWDSTLFCDPKGELTDGSGRGPINLYRNDAISEQMIGGTSIRLGPGIDPNSGESFFHHRSRRTGQNVHVLEHLAERGVTIFNGVDSGLTNHRSGEQLAMAGSTAADFPTLTALVARHNLVDRDNPPNGPMPLLSFGGYDGTANLVPATRLTRLQVLGQITQPDLIGPAAMTSPIHGTARTGLINRALAARQEILTGRIQLPDRAAAMSQLFVARANESHIGRLLQRFNFADFEAMNPGENALERQTYVALRAFEGGLAVGANLMLPGWDTHSYNDAGQARAMRRLFRALVYIKDEAESLGIADRLNVVVGSDFGRTTFYKARNVQDIPYADSGKDHHSVTSWMSMMWSGQLDRGLRIIGESDDRVIARGLTQDLRPVPADQGVVLTPGIIHNELRRVAGISGTALDTQFAISTDEQALRLWA